MMWDIVAKQRPALGSPGPTSFQEAGQIKTALEKHKSQNCLADAQPVMAAATRQTLQCDSRSEGWVIHGSSPGHSGRNGATGQPRQGSGQRLVQRPRGRARFVTGHITPLRPTPDHTDSSGPIRTPREFTVKGLAETSAGLNKLLKKLETMDPAL